jgi:hypothetical protein
MIKTIDSKNFINWKIEAYDNGAFILTYEQAVIEKDGACIVISEEVYNEAKKEELSLAELFEKYSLQNCKKLFSITSPPVYAKPVNTPDKHHGQAYFVTKENGRYYFQYMKSRGVGDRKFEITEEIFEYAKNNDVGVYNIIDKFNLHHLDVPENDVK